jgi:hypothetical protein
LAPSPTVDNCDAPDAALWCGSPPNKEILMKSRWLTSLGFAAALTVVIAAVPNKATDAPVGSGIGPAFESIGTLSFGSNGILYASDPLAASIYALEVSAPAGAVQGTKSVEGIDQKIAAILGTAAAEISIRDVVVDPRSRNSFVAVLRGTGAAARPALLRVDGVGAITIVELDAVKFTSVTLPNPANANPTARNNPRNTSVTDMALVDGKLIVAGLSNEEFASKLWTIQYPFQGADRGASVEIYHGSHGALETRSPVNSFVAHNVSGQTHIIAGYTCTPLVKFPLSSLAPGAKVMGTTIAELGNGNRPIDMIMYRKDGRDFLLMANTSRGVMKIGTDKFASEPAITTPIPDKAGITAETITSLTGVQQLDLLDATHAVVLVRTQAGAFNLEAVVLP